MSVRVRFAPSPTGPLHIGGVRTALYNYLFAKNNNGTFILRVEDTDQKRYVKGAEEYIIEALEWAGLQLDEGPGIGGDYGPYRQSERKHLYKKYAELLVEKGAAYYAFDTPEELNEQREIDPNFKYDSTSREKLRNGITLTATEVELLKQTSNAVIRLKIPQTGTITFFDEIRNEVTFNCVELDDKVILKPDGMPTYHLANIVDDHLMKISHVIRGEEWLSSTAHHAFMYDKLDWDRPKFAHLPLILKPTGKGKLSKRDGAKFGIPVFPITWNAGDDHFPGFREEGFLPAAMINFLAFLGWSAKTEQEIFSLKELIDLFTLDGIVKSGARFDIDKAQWFNQQYIINTSNEDLASAIENQSKELGLNLNKLKLSKIAGLMKERVDSIPDILILGYYLYSKPKSFDEVTLSKKLKPEHIPFLRQIASQIEEENGSNASDYSDKIKSYIVENALKMGEILPVLRIALTGTMKGPDLFETIAFLGSQESKERILSLLDK